MAGPSWSQTADSDPQDVLKQNKLYFIPLPVISYNPAYGFIYGVSSAANILLGEHEDTRLSAGILSATYTSLQQLVVKFNSNIYTSGDKWMFMGDWRYMISSQPTYGLGTGPQSEILLNEDRPGFELGDYLDGVDQAELMEFVFFGFTRLLSGKSWMISMSESDSILIITGKSRTACWTCRKIPR